MRLVVIVSALVLTAVGCGSDASTSNVVSAPSPESTQASSAASTPETPVSSQSPMSSRSLLVDALPEITGPTVLWFWAPG